MSRTAAAVGPLFAVAFAPGAKPAARLPRAEQSAAAETLLRGLRERLGGAEAASSKAHARGMMAAAVTGAGRVGIDVEYRAEGRAIGAIAAWLLGEAAPGEDASYRVFIFREAYFKAFGETPSRDLMRAVARDAEAPFADFRLLFLEPAPDFVLALVWTGEAAALRAEF